MVLHEIKPHMDMFMLWTSTRTTGCMYAEVFTMVFSTFVISLRETFSHFSKETQSAEDLIQDFVTGFH